MALSQNYLEYFRLYQEEKFFEAHEVLEDLWHRTHDKDRKFYQGLIQLAAALVHFQRENLAGTQKLFKTASRYLEPYAPQYKDLDLEKILRDFRKFIEAWEKDPTHPELAREFLPRIP